MQLLIINLLEILRNCINLTFVSDINLLEYIYAKAVYNRRYTWVL